MRLKRAGKRLESRHGRWRCGQLCRQKKCLMGLDGDTDRRGRRDFGRRSTASGPVRSTPGRHPPAGRGRRGGPSRGAGRVLCKPDEPALDFRLDAREAVVGNFAADFLPPGWSRRLPTWTRRSGSITGDRWTEERRGRPPQEPGSCPRSGPGRRSGCWPGTHPDAEPCAADVTMNVKPRLRDDGRCERLCTPFAARTADGPAATAGFRRRTRQPFLTVPLLCSAARRGFQVERPHQVERRLAQRHACDTRPTGRSRRPSCRTRVSKQWKTLSSRFTLNVRPRPSPRWIGQAQRRCGPLPRSRAVRPSWSSTRASGNCRLRWAKSMKRALADRPGFGYSCRHRPR